MQPGSRHAKAPGLRPRICASPQTTAARWPPNSPACSFIHASMAGSRWTAPLNRSNAVLIVAPLFFDIYGHVAYTRRSGASGTQKGTPHIARFLFLNIIRVKFAIAVELNDHGTVLRRNKMRYAGRNEDETARPVPFQLCGVEFS